MAKRPPVLKLTAEVVAEFNMGFSTALRKGIDSKWSVVAFNVLQIVSEDIWSDFALYMKKHLKTFENSITVAQFSDIIGQYDSDAFLQNLMHEDYEEHQHMTKNKKKHVINIFDATMNMMPLDDIASLFHYLNFAYEVRS